MAKRKRKTTKRASASKRWSQHVTEESDALTLEEGVFTKPTPRAVALSLRRSAEASHRRKSSPYRSAMSMLVFFINRAGKGLSKAEKTKLEKAKDERCARSTANSPQRRTRPRRKAAHERPVDRRPRGTKTGGGRKNQAGDGGNCPCRHRH